MCVIKYSAEEIRGKESMNTKIYDIDIQLMCCIHIVLSMNDNCSLV